ncbi:MAG: 3-hydroxyacyl-CoA dehydrogenase family protein [Planctomycetaceae bacterium]|jgi:3-hydroxyacyl-CoA dehydrogenase|nr:3-hydroxyacyl-CoA dehydrogenase family protein [Planctomycetaceae bacterium]
MPTIAILGAGLMGTAIAVAHLKSGFDVVLYDQHVQPLEDAPQRIASELRMQNAGATAIERLSRTDNLDIIASSRCSIVIETIPEKLRAKQALYRLLAALYHDCSSPVLLTNTSTISIAELAVAVPSRENFCGFHFFHPVRERSLVEIIPTSETSPQTLQLVTSHAEQIGKQPIVVGDSPGFLVNRLLNPYLNEALQMLESGTPLTNIEQAATAFGMAMGPFRIMDEIGLDVTFHAGWVLHKAFPERVAASELLMELVHRKKLGRKTGEGFYIYKTKQQWDDNGVINEALLQEMIIKKTNAASEKEIQERLFFGMLLEACRCVDDKVINSLTTADIAVVKGLGFPKERGGLTQWLKNYGIEKANETLKMLEEKYGKSFCPSGCFRESFKL